MTIDNGTVMLRDIRHGIRVLLQAKGWTAVVVLSLAIGIGANAVIFSAVNATLLRTLAVEDPDSLVRLRNAGPNDMVVDSSDYGFTAAGPFGQVHTTFSYPMYRQFREANQTMVDLVASVPMNGVTATIERHAETVSALLVSGNYHSLLGVRPRIGRAIEPNDDRPDARPVAVISERFWRSRLSADPAVIGRVITVAGVAATIVGITPAEFRGTQRPTAQPSDVTIPIAFDPRIRGERRLDVPTNWFVQIMGRLKPGVTPGQVEGSLAELFRTEARAGWQAYLAAQTPEERNTAQNRSRADIPRLVADSGSRGIYDANTNDVRALQIIGVVVALVLLLVCANIANLLLSRAAFRQRELSVRLSMGATRARLIRQLLTESLLLAAMGGAVGILVANWGHQLLPAPIGTVSEIDARVIGVMIAVTGLVAMIFGILPAMRATRIDPGTAFKENSRTVASSNTALSRALLVGQVSVSVVLLVGAGLFLRTVNNLMHVDIGYDPNNLVFVRVLPSTTEFDADSRTRFFEEGLRRLRMVPGVRSATVSFPTLMTGGGWETRLFVQGRAYRTEAEEREGNIHSVTIAPNYFELMGIPLVAGRTFTDADHARSPKVVIINQAAARKLFRDSNPIGQRVGHSQETTGDYEIVGILRDVRYNNLRQPPPPTMYVPYAQRGPDGLVFSVRTATDPSGVMADIRRAVADVNPGIPVVTVETQTSTIESRFAQERVLAQASALFSGIAMFVAAIGLFGQMSYNVSRRSREIGIRMAMGAPRQAVLGLVLREALVLVGSGIAIGIAVALGTGRLVASQLFGLEATDMTTIGLAAVVMTIVSALAGFLPARRATRVDPIVALRYE